MGFLGSIGSIYTCIGSSYALVPLTDLLYVCQGSTYQLVTMDALHQLWLQAHQSGDLMDRLDPMMVLEWGTYRMGFGYGRIYVLCVVCVMFVCVVFVLCVVCVMFVCVMCVCVVCVVCGMCVVHVYVCVVLF